MSVPESLIENVTLDANYGKSAPSDSILFLNQLYKAVDELKDVDAKALAELELKYFRAAMAIINDKSVGGGLDNDNVKLIQIKYGRTLDGVLALAEDLKQIDRKQQADATMASVMDKVLYDADGKGTKKSVAVNFKRTSLFS